MGITEILTDELRKSIPPLGSQKGNKDPMVYAKFLISGSNRVWYIIEGEEQEGDFLFFGHEPCCHYADQQREQWSYFSLSFLAHAGEVVGSQIERDLSFKPKRFSEIV